METEGSLPYSQKPTTSPFPVKYSAYLTLKGTVARRYSAHTGTHHRPAKYPFKSYWMERRL